MTRRNGLVVAGVAALSLMAIGCEEKATPPAAPKNPAPKANAPAPAPAPSTGSTGATSPTGTAPAPK